MGRLLSASVSAALVAAASAAAVIAIDVEADAEAMRLVAFGDSGAGSRAQQNVDGALAEGATGFLGLGDYWYWDEPEEWERIFRPLLDGGSYLARGNHDGLDDLRPFLPDGNTTWTRSLNGVRVVAIDTEQDMSVGSPQWNLARSWLCAAEEDVRVLTMHVNWWLLEGARHPGSEFPGSPEAMDLLVVECGVDLVLASHEHNYQRMMRNDVPYLIVGTGGMSLYDVEGSPEGTVAAYKTYGRLLLDLTPEGYRAEFRDLDGDVLDAFDHPPGTWPEPAPPPWDADAEDFPLKTTGGLAKRSDFDGGQGWNLWSNGHVEQPSDANLTDAEIVVRAVGQPLKDVYPVMVVSRNGVEVGRTSVGGAVAEYAFAAGDLAQRDSVRVSFVNDAVSSTEDRNLLLDTIVLRNASTNLTDPLPDPDPGSVDVTFDHRGGNEWWVQVKLGGPDADAVRSVDARDTDGAWKALELKWWGDWAETYRVEPGHLVQFRATVPDGGTVESCWFTHPEGEERCDATEPPPPSGFDATFRDVRGNEWWVETDVDAVGGTLVGVDARVNGASWVALEMTDWGSWAKTMKAEAGSTVEFRARASDGATDASGPYAWPPK